MLQSWAMFIRRSYFRIFIFSILLGTCFWSIPTEAAQEKLALVLDQSKNLASPEWEEEVWRLLTDTAQRGEINNVSTSEFHGQDLLQTCIEFRSEGALRKAKQKFHRRFTSRELLAKAKRQKVRLSVLPSCVESKINFVHPPPTAQKPTTTTGLTR